MIDHSLVISPTAALIFHLKQGFFLYAWPPLVGFMAIFGYQIAGRVSAMGKAHWMAVFLLGAVAASLSLLGWMMMIRRLEMIPLYGAGVGAANAVLSRVYALTMPKHPLLKIPYLRVIWRGDKAGIENLQKTLQAKDVADHRGGNTG